MYFSALVSKAVYGAFGFQQLLLGIQVAASEDAGKTWTVNKLLTIDHDIKLLGTDRQWLAFGQDDVVYVSFQDTEGLGILVARSDDGGRTFGAFVNAIENSPVGDGYIGGPPMVDASGRLFIPHFTYFYVGYAGITLEQVFPYAPGALRVAWSDDGGETFAVADVYRPEAGEPGAFFPVMVEDARSALHLAWWNFEKGVLIASSLDRGATWTTPVHVGPNVTAAFASPWLLAHDDVLDVLWFAGEHDAESADLLITRIPLGSGVASAVTVGNVTGYQFRGGNTDFAHATLLPDGRVVAVLGDVKFEDARTVVEEVGEVPS
ncbi:MAG TPA: sialidase family protein [Candidatus Thermoplasmatota archaeon]|nr:sialidase family protein [Candidatus Thermoplasmatota archaeon]